MNVLVTGGCGYIGSVLVPHLLADGHRVTVFDPQYFGYGHLPYNENLLVTKYYMTVPPREVFDAVIHLASISNNEMYARNETFTRDMNRYLPEIGSRFIYASSVAAYGTSEDLLTEDTPLRPTTPYGEDKAYCEEQVLRKGGVVVRSASVCGDSANMRFDTTVNRMFKDAVSKGVITVNGGSQKRCHVHIQDLCRFYKLLLKIPEHMVRGQTFNVVESNQKVSDTAKIVADHLGCRIETGPSTDNRSYMVSGMKSKRILDFEPLRTVGIAVHFMKAHHQTRAYKDMDSLQKQRLM